jgi:choline monooxygenase
MIPRENYHNSELLTSELGQLFQPHWQFAAMADELASDRDYVCVDRLDSAVVLQNFRGEIRAFENVCSHRFNRIQPGDRGNRPLICAYHGWNFGVDGYPRGMPRRETFAHVDPETLCLDRFAVERCGPFVFFRQGNSGPDLRTYLGRFYDVLEQVGACFGTEIDSATIPHEANWKLLVENVLECYHCSVVHQQTFGKMLGLGKAGITDAVFDGPHSSSHFPRTQISSEERRKKALAYLDSRGFVHDSFFHIYIFPNLFISSTQGLSFYVGQALPLAAGRTDLRFRLFEPKLELTRAQRAAQDLVNGNGSALGRAVIEEDRTILEQVQRGIALGSRSGAIGTEEVRIAAFMSAYEHLMDGGSLGGIAAIDDQAGAGHPAGRVA